MYIGFIAARILTAYMLFSGLDTHPHTYLYAFTRYSLCATCIHGIFVAICRGFKLWTLILIATAITFNPFYHFQLTKLTWTRLDITIASILLLSLFLLREKY